MLEIRYATEQDKPFWYTLEHEMAETEFLLKVRDRRCYILLEDSRPVGIMRYNLAYDYIPSLGRCKRGK